MVLNSSPDVHSLHLYLVASQGFDLPDYFELMTVDDVPVFYYDSNMKGVIPVPDWLNNTMGQQYWDFLVNTAEMDNLKIVKGLKSAAQQFNVTGASIYQAYGGCDLHPDGTAQAFLTHAFNGKDFVSLDIESKTFIAAVPQAVLYKRMRERDQTNLKLLDYFYRTNCVEGIKEFLRHAPSLRMKRVPEVRLFEKKNSAFTEITCHVTGFYPRTVQVQWFGSDMQPVVEEVDSENKVLSNGDGTYQTRKSVVIPAEHTDIHHYSCVVQHSSISGNITKAWAEQGETGEGAVDTESFPSPDLGQPSSGMPNRRADKICENCELSSDVTWDPRVFWVSQHQTQQQYAAAAYGAGFLIRSHLFQMSGLLRSETLPLQPVVEGVIEGKVLPNGDGSYQTRKSLVIPAEHTDIHHYSCVVQHKGKKSENEIGAWT
ncbi:class I histocompatibility antigen, F10 alpha chain-like [Chanos chanos]|uniref:Class I histocompatibility antigen, F10 alpha chain-like n=1 Tax=Chanos chanos TaxID=29144 RepID=A0A6J2WP74_CHACN|nr:class I histocompatibility antigen, F10 alpha chain-like [Chanos chanos]